MRRTTSWLAAATLAVGGLTFVPQTRAADNPPADTNNTTVTRTDSNTTVTQTDTYNKGDNANVPAPDADAIRKNVGRMTDYAFARKGSFHDVVDYFVDADRDRIGKFKASDNFAKLDGRIDEFQKDWKAKYNEDFDLKKNYDSLNNEQFARIIQGEIGEARTAGGKEVPSAEPQNVKGGTPQDLEKSGVNQPDANSNKHFGGDTNREPGRNIATFLIQGNAQASAAIQPNNAQNPVQAKMEMNKQLPVPMIHEAGGWKVDVPDTMDGQKLYDSLVNHLTKFDEDRANWPADKNEAYREATRHMMTALMETGT
jgi:hypothetical protein